MKFLAIALCLGTFLFLCWLDSYDEVHDVR